MGLRKLLALVLMGAGILILQPASGQAARSDSDLAGEADCLEARQFRISDACVAGSVSARQTVTAWQVMHGTWNGQALDGLSLVLVQTTADDGQVPSTINCYVSHLASPAQRNALLCAYASSQTTGKLDVSAWRVEPAVIKFEIAGHSWVVHLGMIG